MIRKKISWVFIIGFVLSFGVLVERSISLENTRILLIWLVTFGGVLPSFIWSIIQMERHEVEC